MNNAYVMLNAAYVKDCKNERKKLASKLPQTFFVALL